MADMDFELEWDSGFDPDNAQETFEKMLSTADSRLLAVMTQAGWETEKEAKRYVPVDTTNLRDSIESRTQPQRNTILTEVGTNVEYAPHVEYGTRKMAAQPYLRPAVDEVSSKLERRIRMAVLEAAEEAGNG